MLVKLELAGLRRTRWHDYTSRFFFGGLMTALTGLIAKKYGAGIGGLFLAFPAISLASATLIEKHEKEKKRRAGLDGTKRGRLAAGIDAAGAAMQYRPARLCTRVLEVLIEGPHLARV